MVKAQLNHIGIAIQGPDQVKRLEELLSILGITLDHVEDVPSEKVRTYFFPVGKGEPTRLELLEPKDPLGAVGKFLDRRGPGVHHLSFLLERGQLEPVSARLEAKGFRLIYEKPKPGAHGMNVNFIHPATAAGLLIEIMEPGQKEEML